jgi:hypothetical protein
MSSETPLLLSETSTSPVTLYSHHESYPTLADCHNTSYVACGLAAYRFGGLVEVLNAPKAFLSCTPSSELQSR